MRRIIVPCLALLFTRAALATPPTPVELAERLNQRLTGAPLALNSPRLAEMAMQIQKGKLLEAAQMATRDELFYRVTVNHWAKVMSNRSESPYVPTNDFTAMVIGVTRDGRDARTLLTGDFTYQKKGDPGSQAPPGRGSQVSDMDEEGGSFTGAGGLYDDFDNGRAKYTTDLVRVRPQRQNAKMEAAGLLTSSAWAEAHFNMGTNRRAVQYTLLEFLCTPIDQWKETGLPDDRVRRDVDRTPGGNPGTFQTTCRTCHGPMDSFGGAFARFDFQNGDIVYSGKNHVAAKMNRNGNVYPEGYVTMDDSWLARVTPNQMQLFGWRGPTSGKGVKAFGRMVANSERFKTCMTQKVFRELCQREAQAGDRPSIQRLADQFEKDGYNLRHLFEWVAIEPACLGQEPVNGAPFQIGIRNFQQLLETLAAETGVDPSDAEISDYYTKALTRLPKNGRPNELSSTALMAVGALSGLFCKKMIAADAAITDPSKRRAHQQVDFSKAPAGFSQTDREKVAASYARLFWRREPVAEETLVLLELMRKAQTEKQGATLTDVFLPACTAVASSLEAITF